MPRPKPPVLLPRAAPTLKRHPSQARVEHASEVLDTISSALFETGTVSQAVLAIEAAQRAWVGVSLGETVAAVVEALVTAGDVEEARGWLMAVDGRFADLTELEIEEATTAWRAAYRDRRPGPRSGPTCGAVVWRMMRYVGVTSATEQTIDREVRRALRRRNAG